MSERPVTPNFKREILTIKGLKRLFLDQKLTVHQWNFVLNASADHALSESRKSNYDLGIDNHDADDRWAASLYRGVHSLGGVFLATGARLSGGRKQGMVEADLTKPSNINVWANRYADRLREAAMTAHRLNKNFIEKAEESKPPVKNLLETGAIGTSMMSGAVMGLALGNEIFAHGVAVLSGGRKPHVYSIRPTFPNREAAVNYKADPDHTYAAFMRRSRSYQRRPSQLKLSSSFR